MKQRHYGHGHKTGYRIVAIAICVALVIAATAIGFAVIASPGFAVTSDGALVPVDETDEAETNDDTSDNEPRDPVHIEITRYQREMVVGDEAAISYEVRNAAEGEDVKWESSDDGIAKVDQDGTVLAVSAGKAEITATIGDARASILISVAQPVIKPVSFKVNIEEFTSADLLVDTHEMKPDDELHMSAQIEPADATINGRFEWRVSKNGVVMIRESGEINEVAVLKAEKDGEVTVIVRYVDEGGDVNGRVTLDDYTLGVRVIEEKSSYSPFLIAIFAAIVAAVVIILIVIASGRGRRRAEKERQVRIARKRHDGAMRKRARREDGVKPVNEDYERGVRDSEAEPFERITRIYDAPVAPPEPEFPEGDGEPDQPFSEDDIK
jgi:hypothetical protein